MSKPLEPQGRRWSIVLAGGEGVRMQPAVRRWFGRTIPKQYCRFIGTRSLFQHTLDRTMQFTGPARTVVVVGRGQQDAWRIDTPKEPEILRAIYERMPRLNFSRDLLAHVPGDTAVMQMQGCGGVIGAVRTESSTRSRGWARDPP